MVCNPQYLYYSAWADSKMGTLGFMVIHRLTQAGTNRENLPHWAVLSLTFNENKLSLTLLSFRVVK